MLPSPQQPLPHNSNNPQQTPTKLNYKHQKYFTPSLRPHPHRYNRRNHTAQTSTLAAKKSITESVGQNDDTRCRRVFTEQETNDLYSDDFQEADESVREELCEQISVEQKIEEQNQSIPQICTFQHFYKQEENLDKYEFYSVSHLNRCNQKLISQIQFLREMIRRYRYNSKILQQQRGQLNELKKLKKKAVDYTYQLDLDRQMSNKTNISKSTVIEVQCASAFARKQKYKNIKEGHRKANPNSFQMQYTEDRTKEQSKQLSIARQQLLSKKRQFYQYEEELQTLADKVQKYDQLLEIYQVRLSHNNIQGMNTIKQRLQNEIIIKKAKFQAQSLSINLQINGTINQLTSIELKQFQISSLNNRLKADILQIQSQHPQTPCQIQGRMDKNRKKLKVSKKLLKPTQIYSQIDYSPKPILRYFYNPKKDRNSSIFGLSQV